MRMRRRRAACMFGRTVCAFLVHQRESAREGHPVMSLLHLRAAPAVLLARLTAAAALLLLFLATAAIVVAGSHKRSLPHEDVRFITTRLVGFDQSVRTQLVRLGPAGSVTRARRRTREAVAQINALARAMGDAGGTSAARLAVAIRDELRFLDAVGSVLLHPGSPLLGQLDARDAAARRALAELDGPRASRKGGAGALRRLWGSRRAAGAA
jgi:hypothetical protein